MHGDYVKGMETMRNAWISCQRYGDNVNSRETMWIRHEDNAKGIETMPKAWRAYLRHGDYAKGIMTKNRLTTPKAWWSCQRHGV